MAPLIILEATYPATALAQQAGLELGETGGIRVDEHLETSVKDIYAVGDAIEYPHPLTGKPWLNYLANPANRQGRIVPIIWPWAIPHPTKELSVHPSPKSLI